MNWCCQAPFDFALLLVELVNSRELSGSDEPGVVYPHRCERRKFVNGVLDERTRREVIWRISEPRKRSGVNGAQFFCNFCEYLFPTGLNPFSFDLWPVPRSNYWIHYKNAIQVSWTFGMMIPSPWPSLPIITLHFIEILLTICSSPRFSSSCFQYYRLSQPLLYILGEPPQILQPRC